MPNLCRFGHSRQRIVGGHLRKSPGTGFFKEEKANEGRIAQPWSASTEILLLTEKTLPAPCVNHPWITSCVEPAPARQYDGVLTQPSTGKAGIKMDWSAIGGITASISAARDIAKSLSAARDSALISEKTVALMEQLLKAQEGLLSHNATLLQLQDEYFKTREELRELKEAASERGRYSLVEIGNCHFAYRVNIPPQESGASAPSSTEPVHYLCQSCYDKGVKSVLQRRIRAVGLECLCCHSAFHVDVDRLFPGG